MSGSTSKRYPVELRERAVRMVAEIRAEHESEWAAMTQVARAARGRHAGDGAQVVPAGRGRCRRAARASPARTRRS